MMQMKSPTRFSRKGSRVSMASCPNLSSSLCLSEYASSMKSIPPMARFITCSVFWAVSPTYWETRSLRVTSTRWPQGSTWRLLSISAKSLAMVVFPVPGLPRNTKCDLSLTLASGFSRFSLLIPFMIEWISSLTSFRPTKESSFSKISSSVSSLKGSSGMSASSSGPFFPQRSILLSV